MQHLIKLALVALAAVAAYFVYGFTIHVAPEPVAWFAAGSLVGTYIGLAFADIPQHQQLRAQWVARWACAVEAAYGVLFVLHQQSPEWFTAPLSPWMSIPLACLHGAAFSVLAYCVSLFVVHGHAQPLDANAAALTEMRLLLRDMRAQADAVEYSRLPAPQIIYPRAIAVDVPQEVPQPTANVPQPAVCTCGCGKPLSASDIKDRRTRKRNH